MTRATVLSFPPFLLALLLCLGGCSSEMLTSPDEPESGADAAYAETPTAPSRSGNGSPGSSGQSGGTPPNSDSNSSESCPGEPDVEDNDEEPPEGDTTNWYQLSTDDSTSMASAQMFKAHFWGRSLKAHEFLNYYDPPAGLKNTEDWASNEEVSGVSFALKTDLFTDEVTVDCVDEFDDEYSDTPIPDPGDDTPSSPEDHPIPDEDCAETETRQIAEVLFHMDAPPTHTQERRNWNVFLCVDVSGSMGGDKMNFTRKALATMLSHFKEGDRISLVTFDSLARNVFSNLEFSANEEEIREKFAALSAGSSTNMKSGLDLTYELAQNNFDPTMLQRVILFSDGNANVGDTDIENFNRLTRINGQEGIYLSGVGVGRDYDWERMDSLTDAGKGAHVFLPNNDEVDLIFGDYFSKLVEVAADQIAIEMELPTGIRLESFTGEEVSTEPAQRLQNIILAQGDDITFLARFVVTREEALDEPTTLTIRFRPLSTGEEAREVITVPAFRDLVEAPGPMMNRTRLVHRFAQLATGSGGPGVTPQELQAALEVQAETDWGLSEIRGLLLSHF